MKAVLQRRCVCRRACARPRRVVHGVHRRYAMQSVRKVTYAYDALGRRVSTTTLEGTVRHVYDGVQCIADLDSDGEVVARNRYRFQCREWSAATGLVNFRARWYDAVTGRWLSKDPIGLSGGLNLYAFCGDDPVNSLDPFGHNPDGKKCEKNNSTVVSVLTRRHAPSGNDYEGDPFGHNVKPGTNSANDPHFHQYPRHGPQRIFNLDGTPRDNGPPIPKRDLPVVNRVINDVMRALRNFKMPLPIMVMPPSYEKTEDGRLVI